MKRLCILLGGLTVFVIVSSQMASADLTNRYVVKDNPDALTPYDAWTNAAADIQTAVNYAYAGETITVAQAVYDTGGVTNCPAGTLLTNRVAIWKALTVCSSNNDPTNTVIKGAWDPVTTNGPAAVRCVYLTNGSSLIGFMLTNGATVKVSGEGRKGGGVYSQSSTTTILSNCVITANSADYYGGGAYRVGLYNCTIVGNSGYQGGGCNLCHLFNCLLSNNLASYGGGGAYSATLSNCTLVGNSDSSSDTGIGGGGMCGCTLYNCTLTGNTCTNGDYSSGGGAYGGTLTNCTLAGNSATYGGGTRASTLYNCTLVSNTADRGGGVYGGVYPSNLYNCTLISNTATLYGGGAYRGTHYNCRFIGNSAKYGGGARESILYNCTMVGNSAATNGDGGGIYACTSINSIVYFNTCATGSPNWTSTVVFTNSCTMPAYGGWAAGNITNDPLFADTNTANYRLSNKSPCINAGTNQDWMTNSVDLDGKMRIRYGIVDMGAYEWISAGIVFRMQ